MAFTVRLSYRGSSWLQEVNPRWHLSDLIDHVVAERGTDQDKQLTTDMLIYNPLDISLARGAPVGELAGYPASAVFTIRLAPL